MAVNKVPEMLQDTRVYWDGEDNMIGIANVDLPCFSPFHGQLPVNIRIMSFFVAKSMSNTKRAMPTFCV